ncbi:MAG: recombinase family protein [Devosia sp.]
MRRAAIYARYSSDRQNERSCADQNALCEAWAERQGLTVTAGYDDAAISGASTINRMGLAALMRDARARRFDVVVCEALDRLSRDQADLARIKKELAFLDIAIMTVQDGEVGAMHIGLKGLMGELYLADLAQKTRRGQGARVRAGGSGGGRSFGYLPAATAGEMTIVEAEAETIRRIFADYLAGRTARQIAGALNAEKVAGPRGGKWNASTIAGSKSRQNGILQNRLYIGEIVWNRQRFVKDPATGKRISRLNPESEWITAEAPQLAIVERQIFDGVQDRRADRAHMTVVRARPPRHLMSGLVHCGCCGAGYTIINRDRLGCAGRRERQDCDNDRTIMRVDLEARVLDALRRHLLAPDIVAEFIRTYHAERQRLAAAARKDHDKLRRRLDEVTSAIERIVDRIVDGTAPAALEARLPAMEAEQAQLRAELANMDAPAPAVALHPAALDRYRQMVTTLRDQVDAADRTGEHEALIAQVRTLIERIDIHPPADAKKPVDISVTGLIATLLSASDPGRGSMVAGAGFEPATFRL